MHPILIAVPGLNCTRELFAPQIAALQDRRRIVVADQTRDETLSLIARRLLDEAPAERFDLLGLSMGGYVALEVLRQAPERVTRLALLDTTARPDTDEARENRLRQIALAEAGGFDALFPEFWERLVHPDRRSDEALKAIVLGMMRDTGPDAFVRQQRAIMGRPDSRALLPQIEIPTLVLVGEDDALTPPDLAREMANMIEWASLTVVPGSGHLSTLEQPAAVTHALAEWLARGAT